jgi:hypothetical protein
MVGRQKINLIFIAEINQFPVTIGYVIDGSALIVPIHWVVFLRKKKL